jgi:signal transduction histidine kinase
MQAYRWSVRLKLGLLAFALVIAVASLWYTSRLVERLREREQAIIQLWADAQAQVARMQAPSASTSSHRRDLAALGRLVERLPARSEVPPTPGAASPVALDSARRARFREALAWARRQPQGASGSGEVDFITSKILFAEPFTSIPAILADSATGRPLIWRGVDVPDSLDSLSAEDSARAMRRLREVRTEMSEEYAPISIRLGGQAGRGLAQQVYYDESGLIEELRVFPYVQLLFVGLFIAVGYVGFSYVRRSEQSSLWVGMAKEAAHQLGTPISSLMGWTRLLRGQRLSEKRRTEALDEIESDIERLQRVAGRFEDIGSMPKLERRPLAPAVERTAEYVRRRLPRAARLNVDVPEDLTAPINADLFEWVVENLLKNAFDAEAKTVAVRGFREEGTAVLEVRDDGAGIERSQWKNVFRPGYSTKQRGWGLGLSLARRVVENYHGGSLKIARSEVGEGTTFRLRIPEGA